MPTTSLGRYAFALLCPILISLQIQNSSVRCSGLRDSQVFLKNWFDTTRTYKNTTLFLNILIIITACTW